MFLHENLFFLISKKVLFEILDYLLPDIALKLKNKYLINTFASQRLVFEGINEPFFLENASNLTHKFLHDDLS